jgi:dolichyl-phosphate-mannose-protein mannosyltransferase
MSNAPTISSSVTPDAAKPVQPNNQAKEAAAQSPKGELPADISGAPAVPQGARVLRKEEKLEYRDQDGNLLNEEQVKELEGKVEFQTRYETRTRVVDEAGNELEMPEGGWPADYSPVAPPHPDVQGVDKETVRAEGEQEVPKEVDASKDGEKEAEKSQAKPASEGKKATGHEEL